MLEGVTWADLLEDFLDEVVWLETLDVYNQNDIPDGAANTQQLGVVRVQRAIAV